jgi:CRISPR-associated protein Cas5d
MIWFEHFRPCNISVRPRSSKPLPSIWLAFCLWLVPLRPSYSFGHSAICAEIRIPGAKMKSYPVEFEIAGQMAMFARPDTGAAPVSYPAPTWSACKAICESVIAMLGSQQRKAFFSPTAVELWQPIRYERYRFNYRGPLRKQSAVQEDNSYQLPATVLTDVCYRIHADCIAMPKTGDDKGNPAHALQEIFLRRLQRGQGKYPPSLGWREFMPTYFGPPRAEAERPPGVALQTDVDLLLPALLMSVWDSPIRGRYRPAFRERRIVGGVLNFGAASVSSEGLLDFER